MKISSISGLTYPVKDLDRTAEFYASLGFRPGKRDDHQFTCYINWFWVTFTTDHSGEPRPGPALYLKVDDIDDFYGAVLDHGFTAATEPRKNRSGRHVQVQASQSHRGAVGLGQPRGSYRAERPGF